MTCKNCHNSLSDSSDYCNSCGAKVIRNRLTVKNLFASFSEQFLNYDNKFFQTLINLIRKPEDVIGSYVKGTRKKYVNPISFFAITLTISGLYLLIFQKYFPDVMDFSSVYTDENQQKLTEKVTKIMFEYNSFLYFILIPVIALISKIVFYNKAYNITEHTVIYLYSLSFWSLFSSLINLIFLLVFPEGYMTLSTIITVSILIYHAYILKRIFKLSISNLIIKTLIFVPLFFIAYIGLSLLLMVILFLTGELSIQDFAPTK